MIKGHLYITSDVAAAFSEPQFNNFICEIPKGSMIFYIEQYNVESQGTNPFIHKVIYDDVVCWIGLHRFFFGSVSLETTNE